MEGGVLLKTRRAVSLIYLQTPGQGCRFADELLELMIGSHVVDPRADQPCWHSPDRHVGHLARGTSAGNPASVGQPDGSKDTCDDAQGVGADRDRAQIPNAMFRAGNEQWVHESDCTNLLRSSAISAGEVAAVQSSFACPECTAKVCVPWFTS